MSACTMNLLKLAQPVGIDQLSLTFDVPIKYRPTCKAKLYEVAAEYGYGSKVIEYPNSKNYRNSLYIPQFGNLFIQSEPCGRLKPRTEDNHGARWLKFKFNPNKVPDFAALRCLLRILLQQYYQNLNHHTVMTEIDFNLDYYTDRDNDFFVDTKHYAKSLVFKSIGYEYDRGLVGTIYLGGKKSKNNMRIYNKTAEIREKSRADSYTLAKRGYTACPADKTLVRFEAKFSPRVSFAEFSNFSNNIFQHITVYSMPNRDEFLPFFLSYAKEHSLHAAFDLLARTHPEQVDQIKRLIERYQYKIDLEDMGSGMIAAWADFIDIMAIDDD